ncbi:hypothetical protein NUH16_002978 [Penicillium rubens]|nr:hypothetical protein NUH16_002978 [Penicillium rubens]
MEALLAHSFDYLSSYEPSKIRKGLRQVEGLLAQICLSKPKPVLDRRSRSPEAQPVPKTLSELRDDPAFREFSKLQESFQWNSRGSNGTNDMLIVCTLDLIQGSLLLHRGSRTLFAREIYMNLLLDLLDPINCPAVQSATLLTLVTALLDCPSNTRTFEGLDGLLTVTSLFKLRATSREVKLKLVEFLYFYLMPEAMTPAPMSPPPGLQRSPSKLSSVPFSRSAHSAAANAASKANRDTRTTDEKQALLGRYLNNVEDLVEDLKETAPFGTTVY